MKSNYKTLGDYIQEVKTRNTDLSAKDLLGINIDKFFMPSVANIVGTDLSAYRIVKKNQFACNRMHVGRDYRIPISLSRREEPFMVSPAYDVFEIKDTKVLDPEFLMMWFSRAEYDRNAWFYTDADVRGGLPWKAFTDMKFPLLSPTEQKELVAEYESIQDRIRLNRQLIQKIEETAQTIFKENLITKIDRENLPDGWKVDVLENYCSKITKGTTPEKMASLPSEEYPIKYIKGESLNDKHSFDFDKISFIDEKTHESLKRSQLEEYDICYSIAGTLDKFAVVDKEILPANTNQAIAIIRVDEHKINRFYVIGLFMSQLQMEFYNFNIQQAVQANLSLETIASLPIIIPDAETLKYLGRQIEILYKHRLICDAENRNLLKFNNLLLAKMASA